MILCENDKNILERCYQNSKKFTKKILRKFLPTKFKQTILFSIFKMREIHASMQETFRITLFDGAQKLKKLAKF
jgi:hypothetical protein